jgi:hypothetical protein
MDHVSDVQIAFGKKLGLDLIGKTVGEAHAMILDVIDREFSCLPNTNRPTPKQIELAAKFGRDISGISRRVGDAIINDLMTNLNHEAIEREQLAPGVVVTNKHDLLQREFVVSSIAPDGTVYFKGGNGAKAWARSLNRVDEN